jgi:hypothetical protein
MATLLEAMQLISDFRRLSQLIANDQAGQEARWRALQ